MLWRTRPKLQLGSLNLSSSLHKERVLGPKMLLCIEEIENPLSQVLTPFFNSSLQHKRAAANVPSRCCWMECRRLEVALELGLRLWVLLQVLNVWDSFEKQGQGEMGVAECNSSAMGQFLGCHGESNHHAVLCCNSLRNTMATAYSSADLWGCWSTYSKAYFSPPIAIFSCCQQMFCNSSCILLLGTDRNKPWNPINMEMGYTSFKNFFFPMFSLPFTPDLKF